MADTSSDYVPEVPSCLAFAKDNLDARQRQAAQQDPNDKAATSVVWLKMCFLLFLHVVNFLIKYHESSRIC